MVFDWKEYLIFAEEIKLRPEESAKRSAISRAYYCVFHKAKNYATEHLGYIYRPDNPSHAGMWREFKNKGITLNAIYNYGMKLKNFREVADYYDEFENIESSLIQTFHNANHVLKELKNLESKKNLI